MSKPASKPVGVETVAHVLGLTTRRVQQLTSEGVFAKEGRGRYDLVSCVQAYVGFWQDKAEARSAAEHVDGSLEESKARKMAAEAELAELQLARERGELVTVEDAVKERTRDYGHLRAKMLNMPAKYAPSTVGCRTIAESKVRWEDAVAEALSVLSDTDDEYNGDE